MRSVVRTIGAAAAAGLVLVPLMHHTVQAQTAGQSLGSVTVSRAAKANGEALPAGTYTLRLLPGEIKSAVGQTPAESRWVEFVRGGKVVGKEVATVMTGAEAKVVAKGGAPAPGSAKTELLKGNDYLRIWINRGGTHYLVHLTLSKATP
jgi:hypothetical protein